MIDYDVTLGNFAHTAYSKIKQAVPMQFGEGPSDGKRGKE